MEAAQMIEQEVVVNTRYGRQPAFAACPDAPGQFPAIILYMDAPGFREELCVMGKRIAKHGYFCLVPDLYYRVGTLRFDIPRRNDAMSAVIRGAMKSLSNASVAEDTAGMIAFLDGQDKVKPGPLGCVGHCMSGPFALTVAARFPRMRAAASLYGVDLVTDQPDSPHLTLDRIKGEAAGTKYRMETYEGVHHGFCFANRPDYDPIAAEESWTRVFDLWDRNLK
jgi:carboxymethylenebutenolidase